MNREEAIQALLALEGAETARQREEQEQRAASESLAAAHHWEQCELALHSWLSEVVYAAVAPVRPDNWNSQTKEYNAILRLPEHAPIACRFVYDGGAWAALPWRKDAEDTPDRHGSPYWAVCGYHSSFYHRLACALVRARLEGEKEIPF